MSVQLLQEYLIKAGFKIDEISGKKFTESLSAAEKNILKVGNTALTVIGAVEAMTAAFAYSMRKTYFDAQLSNSTVKSLEAISFAGTQVGISADEMTGMIKQAANAMYGLQGSGVKNLAKSLGLSDHDLENTTDAVKKLFHILHGNPSGPLLMHRMFGFSTEQYRLIDEHMDRFDAQDRKLEEIQRSMNYDPGGKQMKENVTEYTSEMDELIARMTILWELTSNTFAPAFTGILHALNIGTENLTHTLNPSVDSMLALTPKSEISLNDKSLTVPHTYVSSATGGRVPVDKLLALAQRLEMSTDTAVSPSGAIGRNQIMPSTAENLAKQNNLPYSREMLFNRQYNDNMASLLLTQLNTQYNGNLDEIFAAYNGGTKVADRFKASGDDPMTLTANHGEGRKYLNHLHNILSSPNSPLGTDSGSKTITVNNTATVNVTSTGQADHQLGATVANAVSRQLGDATRNAIGPFR